MIKYPTLGQSLYSKHTYFLFYKIRAPDLWRLILLSTMLVLIFQLQAWIFFLHPCNPIKKIKNLLLMFNQGYYGCLTLFIMLIRSVNILDRPKSHHPMGSILVVSYCTYQYTHKIGKACVQKKSNHN